MKNPNFLSKTDVAKKLNISKATLENWIRQRRLVYHKDKGFDSKQIEKYYNEILKGNGKLNSRANKKFSIRTFIPSEYISNQKNYGDIVKILSISRNLGLDLESILIYTAYRILELEGLLLIEKGRVKFINKGLEQDIKDIFPDFLFNRDVFEQFLWLKGEFQDDFLGALYQSVKNEGEKSEGGSYYTPKFLVENIVQDVIKPNSKILDPCCGTGQFLITAGDIVKSPKNIYGYDIDKIAVGIARINIHLRYKEVDFRAKIFYKDALLDESNPLFIPIEEELFDVVITNPPWGASFTKEEKSTLKTLFPEIKTTESFSYFLIKGLDLLKKQGRLVYILPEAFLFVRKHSDIRKYLIDNSYIEKICHYGRLFKGVFSPVIRLDVRKERLSNMKIYSRDNLGEYNTTQQSLSEDKSYKFNVFLSEMDKDIIKKVYAFPSVFLENQAVWALGIVTGDNNKYMKEKKLLGYEPVIKGSDINKYSLKRASSFIKFEPSKFQQVAPENIYRAREKLVYKFISKKLVFAYDGKGLLTLNSANILIPQIEEYPIKSILALLNSSLYQFLFQKKFNTIKVLRGDLEKMPFPLLSPEQHLYINNKVNRLLQDVNDKEKQKQLNAIDNYITDIFSLSEEEKFYINKFS